MLKQTIISKIDQMSAKLLYDQIKLNQPFSPQK